jgi:PAS domain S-box-containing protein
VKWDWNNKFLKTDLNSPQNMYNKSADLIKKMELSIELQNKIHAAMDQLLEGVQIIDSNWRYIYANDAVVEQSKFSREELIGFTMMEKYPGIENTDLFRVLSECMKSGIACHFENEFKYPDGSTGWFDLSIQPRDGGLTILSNDVTKQKKSELEKKQYFQQIERILYLTSHYVRQPVVQIQGIVNLLKSHTKTHKDYDKMLEYLYQAVIDMDKYTREITEELGRQSTTNKI